METGHDMASQLSKRLAAAEAKYPPVSPAEAALRDDPWFLELLARNDLDIDQLKQKASILAALPLNVLQEMRDELLAMD